MKTRPGPVTRVQVRAVTGDRLAVRPDRVATEEPLEIRIDGAGPLTVTMRTPGHDFELAAGFLHAEGLLGAGGIRRMTYCTDPSVDAEQQYNIVNVGLDGPAPELPDRRFAVSSACGVCGKASLDALSLRGCAALPVDRPAVPAEVVYGLPDALRAAQRTFETTGGLHAAGLFTAAGELLCVREDVGRHNAVDKLVGWALLDKRLPLAGHILMVSGRTSYEITQKALVAGIPIVCAVSAPSSLAVSLADEFGLTLVGFLRDERFNIYSHPERLSV
jgi:FdhD protein